MLQYERGESEIYHWVLPKTAYVESICSNHLDHWNPKVTRSVNVTNLLRWKRISLHFQRVKTWGEILATLKLVENCFQGGQDLTRTPPLSIAVG